ncbi:DUF1542 domain-containing protein, partial [Streptococcus equi]|uniref:DUF1542 domain-containing protein n=1 Tax=Streptococcus equi TaxID=1336 RepID=UPI0005621EC9
SEAEKAAAIAEIEADKQKALEAVTNATTPEGVETAQTGGIGAIEAKTKMKELPKTGLNPKTGDLFNIETYLGLASVSGVGLIALGKKKRRKKEK